MPENFLWLTTAERGHTLARKGGEELIVLGLNADGVAKDESRRSVSSFPACISLLGEGSAGIVSEGAAGSWPDSRFELKLYRSRRTKLTRRTIRI